MRAWEEDHRELDASSSVGLWVREDGDIEDTIEGMDAARAGIGPGMRIVAVNGRRFTPQILRDALAAAKDNAQRLALLVENADYFRIAVDARGLDYSVYFEEGERTVAQLEEYTSASTHRLDVDELQAMLLTLPEIRSEMHRTGRRIPA